MRSQKAEEVLNKVRSRVVPYDVTFDNVTVCVHKDVYPTSELSTLMVECIKNPDFGIKEGDAVLDYGTGTGYLAIMAALNGAGKVIAIDINPAAVNCAQANVERYKLEDKIEVRQSDGFQAVYPGEKFDCILAGMPWESVDTDDMLERSVYDPEYRMRRDLFNNAKNVLTSSGKIFTTWSERMQAKNKMEDFDNRYEYKIVVCRNIREEPHYVYMIRPK
jgi:methylase of polypeptide subunit release factors